MNRITAKQLAAWLNDPARPRPQLVDVREPWEVETCRISASVHVPLRELPGRLEDLDPGTDTVLICHHGARSLQAAVFLSRQGFEKVHNLEGGVDAWARDVDPAMPVY